MTVGLHPGALSLDPVRDTAGSQGGRLVRFRRRRATTSGGREGKAGAKSAMASSSDDQASCEGPTDAQRDRDLLSRHQQGDRQAFEEYYQRFAPLVYNLAMRQCGDPELAKDLSQEAFLRLFRNLEKFEGRSSLKTWTYRVVLNHCRSRLARRRPHQQLAVDADGRERPVTDDRRGPEGRVEAADGRRQIAMALVHVEPSYREALVLREIEDLSYQEIAEVLEVPVGTVRSRIARGRERLRKALLKGHSGEAQSGREGEPR